MFSVCSHLGGGQVRGGQVQLAGGVRSSRGGSGPARWGGQVQPGGVRSSWGGQVQLGGSGLGGVRSSWGGQVQLGGSGPARGGSGPAGGGGQLQLAGGGQVQPGGSGSCTLLRAVCLLHSRRRTFLFSNTFYFCLKNYIIRVNVRLKFVFIVLAIAKVENTEFIFCSKVTSLFCMSIPEFHLW